MDSGVLDVSASIEWSVRSNMEYRVQVIQIHLRDPFDCPREFANGKLVSECWHSLDCLPHHDLDRLQSCALQASIVALDEARGLQTRLLLFVQIWLGRSQMHRRAVKIWRRRDGEVSMLPMDGRACVGNLIWSRRKGGAARKQEKSECTTHCG